MHITTGPAEQVVQEGPGDGGRSEGAVPGLDGVVVVGVSGEVDLYSGPRLRAVLQELLPSTAAPAGGRRGGGVGADEGAGERGAHRVRAVVVDLTEVTFLDSYALGVLVHGHRLARPGGQAYAVVATLEMIHTLFRVTGLAKVLPLHPDVATAVQHLHPTSTGPGR